VTDIVASKTAAADTKKTALRIVAVSDTHGMERILTDAVPDGDILIHAGDYAHDGGKARHKYEALDKWLAGLPHPVKIIVRGNHDPMGARFPLSKAIYASRATTVVIKGIRVSLAPHGTLQVPFGHVIISHEPPFGTLDEPIKRSKNAGSIALERSVSKAEHKPQLWIFGHIHEGFGAMSTSFTSKASGGVSNTPTTLCVNAANANPGPAHKLVNLPVTIDVQELIPFLEPYTED
jgi:Icc-related predicted phosphoesterase